MMLAHPKQEITGDDEYKVLEFSHIIPDGQQMIIKPCPHCFVELTFLYSLNL